MWLLFCCSTTHNLRFTPRFLLSTSLIFFFSFLLSYNTDRLHAINPYIFLCHASFNSIHKHKCRTSILYTTQNCHTNIRLFFESIIDILRVKYFSLSFIEWIYFILCNFFILLEACAVSSCFEIVDKRQIYLFVCCCFFLYLKAIELKVWIIEKRL